ncbi:MAG: class II aldolase/adducin family protein [bacterium]|nr:class II aldolase/adducin family protein [bacterium]
MSKYASYKEQVFETARTLWEGGFFGTKSGSGGNVSCLIEGEEAVAVTPSSRPYKDMTVDDICVVDFELDAVDGDELPPSIETPMHIAVYKNRQDANAVVHTHQPCASIFGLLNEPIPALFDEAIVSIGNVVEVVPYALSGSSELLENVASKLVNRCNCYILQNHGALSIGKNLDKACHHAELLEKIARIYHGALATGRPVSLLPEEMSGVLFEFMKGSQDMEIARKSAQ